jgi:hypothetical protein
VLAELRDLTGKVDHWGREVELLKVNLLGGVGADTEHGRLPKLETEVRGLEPRVKALEEDKIQRKAYLAAVAALGGFIGGLVGLVIQILK